MHVMVQLRLNLSGSCHVCHAQPALDILRWGITPLALQAIWQMVNSDWILPPSLPCLHKLHCTAQILASTVLWVPRGWKAKANSSTNKSMLSYSLQVWALSWIKEIKSLDSRLPLSPLPSDKSLQQHSVSVPRHRPDWFKTNERC